MSAETTRTREIKPFRWSRFFLKLIFGLLFLVALASALFMARNQLLYGSLLPADTDSHRINILLVGIDEADSKDPKAAHRADSMLLCGIHTRTGAVSLLSIPRDTRVVIPGHGSSFDKFGHAYAYGGPGMTVATVEDFLKIPVHHYVVAEWQGFIRVVDALGGVDLYVDADMNYEDPYQNLKIHLKKGFQHLDGQQAGEYVRFRHDEMGDIGRVARQQKFMKAFASQAIRLSNIPRIPLILSTISESVQTNLTPLTFFRVLVALPTFKGNRVQAEMVPGNFANIAGLSYWAPDRTQTQKVVDRLFIKPPISP